MSFFLIREQVFFRRDTEAVTEVLQPQPMSPHGDKTERSQAEFESEIQALRAHLAAKDHLLETRDSELQLSTLQVKSHEAKISKLKKTPVSKNDFIDWILKQRQGPKLSSVCLLYCSSSSQDLPPQRLPRGTGTGATL